MVLSKMVMIIRMISMFVPVVQVLTMVLLLLPKAKMVMLSKIILMHVPLVQGLTVVLPVQLLLVMVLPKMVITDLSKMI